MIGVTEPQADPEKESDIDSDVDYRPPKKPRLPSEESVGSVHLDENDEEIVESPVRARGPPKKSVSSQPAKSKKRKSTEVSETNKPTPAAKKRKANDGKKLKKKPGNAVPFH